MRRRRRSDRGADAGARPPPPRPSRASEPTSSAPANATSGCELPRLRAVGRLRRPPLPTAAAPGRAPARSATWPRTGVRARGIRHRHAGPERSGPASTGPMQVVLRSRSDATPTTARCRPVRSAARSQSRARCSSAPNAVTTVPVNLPVQAGRNAQGIGTFDALGLSILAPGVTSSADRPVGRFRSTGATMTPGPEITQRELRNGSGDIMRALDRGEAFVVTRNGVPVGEFVPLRARSSSRRRRGCRIRRRAGDRIRPVPRRHRRGARPGTLASWLTTRRSHAGSSIRRSSSISNRSPRVISYRVGGVRDHVGRTRRGPPRDGRPARARAVDRTGCSVPRRRSNPGRGRGGRPRLRSHLRCRRRRRSEGARSATFDLLIAATALASDLPLYTRNPDDFPGTESLIDIVAVEPAR